MTNNTDYPFLPESEVDYVSLTTCGHDQGTFMHRDGNAGPVECCNECGVAQTPTFVPAAYTAGPVPGCIVVVASPTSDWGAVTAIMPDDTRYTEGIIDLIADNTRFTLDHIREMLSSVDFLKGIETIEIEIVSDTMQAIGEKAVEMFRCDRAYWRVQFPIALVALIEGHLDAMGE